MRISRHYTPRSLRDLPTLSVGQCCSLKVETADRRVWLCRVGGGVSVERLEQGRWVPHDGDCNATDGAST